MKNPDQRAAQRRFSWTGLAIGAGLLVPGLLLFALLPFAGFVAAVPYVFVGGVASSMVVRNRRSFGMHPSLGMTQSEGPAPASASSSGRVALWWTVAAVAALSAVVFLVAWFLFFMWFSTALD